jgi:DNA-directed RNA polymerase subunit H (RpoH/RPB5)
VLPNGALDRRPGERVDPPGRQLAGQARHPGADVDHPVNHRPDRQEPPDRHRRLGRAGPRRLAQDRHDLGRVTRFVHASRKIFDPEGCFFSQPAMSLWYDTPHQRARVCTTLWDMLQARGYGVVLDDGLLAPDEQDQLADFPLVAVNQNNRLTAVYFCPEPKMSVGALRRLRDILHDVDRLECVVAVVHHSVTPVAIKEARAEEMIHLFQFGELMFNPTASVAVSRHRRIDDPTEVVKKFHSKPEQFPAMYTDDPIARYYGWPAGTVVEVDRRLAGFRQIMYRLVAERPP